MQGNIIEYMVPKYVYNIGSDFHPGMTSNKYVYYHKVAPSTLAAKARKI